MPETHIPYQIIRSSRRTISLQITPEGQVVVRCPNRMRRADIDQFVKSKAAWLEKHLEARRNSPAQPPLSETQRKELAARALEKIPERVAWFAPRVGVSWGRITIRCQRTRWGSCSAQGNLNFNCLLMLAPEEVLDYVVVHELCHRLHMNHSPAFWAQVERVLPDYKSRRKWLKENGGSLIARIS